MRPASAAPGMGDSSTACTHVNIVVLAPIPRPSDTMAASARPGVFARERQA